MLEVPYPFAVPFSLESYRKFKKYVFYTYVPVKMVKVETRMIMWTVTSYKFLRLSFRVMVTCLGWILIVHLVMTDFFPSLQPYLFNLRLFQSGLYCQFGGVCSILISFLIFSRPLLHLLCSRLERSLSSYKLNLYLLARPVLWGKGCTEISLDLVRTPENSTEWCLP